MSAFRLEEPEPPGPRFPPIRQAYPCEVLRQPADRRTRTKTRHGYGAYRVRRGPDAATARSLECLACRRTIASERLAHDDDAARGAGPCPRLCRADESPIRIPVPWQRSRPRQLARRSRLRRRESKRTISPVSRPSGHSGSPTYGGTDFKVVRLARRSRQSNHFTDRCAVSAACRYRYVISRMVKTSVWTWPVDRTTPYLEYEAPANKYAPAGLAVRGSH